MPRDTLTVVDNRTGRSYELPVEHNTIRATDLAKIRVGDEAPGLFSYDPAFMNTASCRSRITYIDGDKGILLYRGYPIEQLAERSSFLETAYLLLKGELPSAESLAQFTSNIRLHTIVHENIKSFMEGFRYDAHPMGMLVSTMGALSTFYPEAKNIHDPLVRQKQVHRLAAVGLNVRFDRQFPRVLRLVYLPQFPAIRGQHGVEILQRQFAHREIDAWQVGHLGDQAGVLRGQEQHV